MDKLMISRHETWKCQYEGKEYLVGVDFDLQEGLWRLESIKDVDRNEDVAVRRYDHVLTAWMQHASEKAVDTAAPVIDAWLQETGRLA
jgi:hypothetical protein